jgi:DNA repair protein RecO
MKVHETNLIVLRKIPYSETSLVVNCLSPNLGRVDILVKGALRMEKRKFPEIDLFNEIAAFFRESRSGTLHTLSKSELLASALEIANHPANLASAMDVAKFILANTHFNMHTARLYKAMTTMIADLTTAEADASWRTFIRLVYLDEQGFLPNYEGKTESANFAKMLHDVFSFCDGKIQLKPKLTAKYIEKLRAWTSSICLSHSIPDS